MEYNDAIAKIDDPEIVEAITGKVTKLIGENRKYTNRTRDLEAKVQHMLEVVGAEGEDLNTMLDNSQKSLKKLSDDLNAAIKAKGEAEQAKAQAEEKVATFEKKATLATVAQKAGVVPEVLSLLVSDISIIKVEGDAVTLEGKSLKEYAASNPDWKPFLPALFPGQQTATPEPPRLPTGSPNGTSATGGTSQGQQGADPVKNYIESTYSIPSYLKNEA